MQKKMINTTIFAPTELLRSGSISSMSPMKYVLKA
jgi:hypothetical protein